MFIHGGDWVAGSSQQYPGHVLATREVVVVTFNYRLGALGMEHNNYYDQLSGMILIYLQKLGGLVRSLKLSFDNNDMSSSFH